MTKKPFLFASVVVGLAVLLGAGKMMKQSSFQVYSNDIKPHQMLNKAQVYNAGGCTGLGDNISPQLAWANAPEGTKSFAIICHDPDAPHATGWYHWLVVNIPADISEIAADAKINNALETITDFKQNAYGGACPPVGHGIHHYNFSVYALDCEKLDVAPNTSPVEVEKLVQQHALAQATLTGLYERK